MATEHELEGGDAQALRYAEGELTAQAAAAFELHAGDCARCQALLGAAGHLAPMLGDPGLAPPPLSEADLATLLERLGRDDARRAAEAETRGPLTPTSTQDEHLTLSPAGETGEVASPREHTGDGVGGEVRGSRENAGDRVGGEVRGRREHTGDHVSGDGRRRRAMPSASRWAIAAALAAVLLSAAVAWKLSRPAPAQTLAAPRR